MSKKAVALFIIVLIFLLSACDSVKEDDPIEIPTWDKFVYPGLDIEPETDYSNIVAVAENESYSQDADKITVMVTNNNVGKGFYIYSESLLQKEKNGLWVNVKRCNSYAAEWAFVGVEGNTTQPNSVPVYVLPEREQIKLSKGNYRLIIFLADGVLYANFTID